jgi:hypothetical protein
MDFLDPGYCPWFKRPPNPMPSNNSFTLDRISHVNSRFSPKDLGKNNRIFLQTTTSASHIRPPKKIIE